MKTDVLARVKKAAKTRRRAEPEYRAAIVAAHADGSSLGEIAAAAGVTKQAVWALLDRAKKEE